jgi:hypothetical protein
VFLFPVTLPDKKVKRISEQDPAIETRYLLVMLQGTEAKW